MARDRHSQGIPETMPITTDATPEVTTSPGQCQRCQIGPGLCTLHSSLPDEESATASTSLITADQITDATDPAGPPRTPTSPSRCEQCQAGPWICAYHIGLMNARRPARRQRRHARRAIQPATYQRDHSTTSSGATTTDEDITHISTEEDPEGTEWQRLMERKVKRRRIARRRTRQGTSPIRIPIQQVYQFAAFNLHHGTSTRHCPVCNLSMTCPPFERRSCCPKR